MHTRAHILETDAIYHNSFDNLDQSSSCYTIQIF